MDQVQEILDSGSLSLSSSQVNWKELLELFANLEETERRRFSWVAPNEDDLKWVKDLVIARGVDRLIGIGCGSGFLERVVADYCGVPVVGVELKDSWWMSKFHPRIFVPIEFTNSRIEREFAAQECFQGDDPALLFCYFNNKVAFNEYLKCFGRLRTLILVGPINNVGIHTDPMPLSPEFTGGVKWTFVDCKYLVDNLNVIAVYEREENKF